MSEPSRRRPGVPVVAIAVTVVVVVVCSAAGWILGVRAGGPIAHTGAVEPIPGVSPSVPVFVPYSPDIDYPALRTHLSYDVRRIGHRPYLWKYAVPKGWVSYSLGANEVRWRPPGEPLVGGYFLRVKLVSSHLTPPQMVRQKYAALQSCCQDVNPIQRQWNTIGVTYRDPDSNTQRWDIFRWLTAAGSNEAEFEMSVGGRSVDDPGLEDLLTRVSASAQRLTGTIGPGSG